MREAVIPNMTGTQETLVELVNEQVTRSEKSESKSGSLFTIPTCLSMGPSPLSSMSTFGCLKAHPVLSLAVRTGFALHSCLTW